VNIGLRFEGEQSIGWVWVKVKKPVWVKEKLRVIYLTLPFTKYIYNSLINKMI